MTVAKSFDYMYMYMYLFKMLCQNFFLLLLPDVEMGQGFQSASSDISERAVLNTLKLLSVESSQTIVKLLNNEGTLNSTGDRSLEFQYTPVWCEYMYSVPDFN